MTKEEIKKRVDGFDALMKESLDSGVFPGANYVIVSNYGTFYNSFGYKTLMPEKEENDINTKYDMASCTKVLCTTSCIFKLMEMGKIRLYDEVKKYLPLFPHEGVTIFDLMTHSSGLPAGIGGADKRKEKQELLDKIWEVKMIYEKNQKIVYSDIGFILLGLIVEEVSGMGLDEFSKKYIFDPLEMYNTGFNRTNKPVDIKLYAATEVRNDDVIKGLVRGYVHDENAYCMGGVSGHAGLFSTVGDISHFITMVLNDGIYNGKEIFSKATIDLMFTPFVREPKGVSLDCTQRGLGWIVRGDYCGAGDLASPETIHHTGFTGTNVCIDRINKVGWSILSNRVHPTRQNGLLIPMRSKYGNYIISHFGGR